MTAGSLSNSVWIRPDEAIANRERLNVIFPTKLNLMKLATARSVDDAMRAAQSAPPLTVVPWVEKGPEGLVLRIREDAGYEQTSALMKEAM